MADLATIIALARAGAAMTDAATRALEAANNGDQDAAERYLTEARGAFGSAREKWDEAGQAGR